MSVPSKVHNIQLVKIQPGERLAAAIELNPACGGVTDCRGFQETDADIGAITLVGGGL